MLEVAQAGIDTGVFVRHIIAIGIPHFREVGCVRNPKGIAPPDQSLNAVESLGEADAFVSHTVLVQINEQIHMVAGCFGFGASPLGALSDVETSF